jgi:two-component system, OmpR family, sensor kinase
MERMGRMTPTTEDAAPPMPRRTASWRVRLLGWYLLLVGIATATSLIALRTVVLIQLDQSIENDLQQEVDELRRLAGGNDPDTGRPFGDDVRALLTTFLRRNIPGEHETFVTFVDGEPFLRAIGEPPLRLDLLPEAAELWASIDQPERGQVDTSVGTVDFMAVPLLGGDDGAVFVAASFTELARLESERPVLVAAVIEGLVGLLVAGVLAWVLTARMVRPVSRITETVRSITASGLGRRVPVEADDELGRLAATFNQMLDRLDEAFGTQRRFLANASHELRTPITIVRGHLEVMGDDHEERAHTIRLVTEELDRMGRMVEELLTLARSERPDFIQVRRIDLDELLMGVHGRASALGDRRWVIDEMAIGAARLDPERITQALVALADNAAGHTVDGDEIGLGSRIEGPSVVFWVRDTGPGVPPSEQDAIFDRFHRGSDARDRPGSGLGLSIVATIARAHGGDADVTSDEGATFRIRIPIEEWRPDEGGEA